VKILHTADWHLGKIVNSVHMTEDQAYVLSQLVDIVRQEKPDVIIIAGDIYDRSIPPKEAVELLDRILTQLITEFNSPILIISGNHDSPDRLQFGSRLFRENNLHIETKLTREMRAFTFDDQAGPVHFHLVPYIEPADARTVFEDENIQSHQQAMEAIVSRIKQRENMDERHVFIGHAFLAGGMESDSEERLSMIGGSPYIDSHLFKEFSYVALGHLHQPQKVTHDWIQYSGSILKYSFSEANHTKSVNIIDLAADKTTVITRIPFKPKRDMRLVEGFFDEFINGDKLAPTEDYLHIRLLDDGQILDPIGKLRKKFPNTLRLERKVLRSNRQLDDLNHIRKKQQMTHAQLFHTFYEEMKGESITEERKNHIDQVIQKLMEQERGK